MCHRDVGGRRGAQRLDQQYPTSPGTQIQSQRRKALRGALAEKKQRRALPRKRKRENEKQTRDTEQALCVGEEEVLVLCGESLQLFSAGRYEASLHRVRRQRD